MITREHKPTYLVAVTGLSRVLDKLSLVNTGMSTLDVVDGVTGDSSVELGVVVAPVDNGIVSVRTGIASEEVELG